MLGTRAGSNERRYQPGFHQQEIPVGEMGTQEFYVFFRIPPILWVNSGIPVGGILRSCVKIRKMQQGAPERYVFLS